MDADGRDGAATPSSSRDTNDSFVKKVTTRVSELIPDTLTKWFSSKRALIRRRDSSSEDESSPTNRPPTKRTCLGSDRYADGANFDRHYYRKSEFSRSAVDESKEFLGAGPKRDPDARFLKLYETARVADVTPNSSRSGSFDKETPTDELESTARKAVTRYETQTNGAEKTDSEDSTSGCSSMAQKNRTEPFGTRRRGSPYDKTANFSERSLFSKTESRANSSLSSRLPSFDASSFGSPTLVDRTLTTERIANSPFYSGRTRFGGASSLRTTVRLDRRPRASVDVRPKTSPRDENSAAELSKTARRILDALDRISSPVEDIRNMPSPRGGPPTKALRIPTVCELLRMKSAERLRESTETVREIATRADRPVGEYRIRSDDDASRHSNKIRAKISKMRGDRNGVGEPSERVRLPEVPLVIDEMPKFDIPLPVPKRDRPGFEFSAPIPVSGRTVRSYEIAENFRFSEPIVVEDRDPKTEKSPSVALKRKPLASVKRSEETWECDVCLVRNGVSAGRCVACGGAKPGSAPPVPFGDRFKMPSDEWECTTCLVRNADKTAACVACTSPRPAAKNGGDPAPPAVVPNLAAALQRPADTWLCDVCLIRNKLDDCECVACRALRPGAPPKPPPTKVVRDWECSTCLVRNSPDVDECVCCCASRPGAAAPSVTIPGAPPPGTFKFGIDATDSTPTGDAVPKGFVFGESPAVEIDAGTFTFGIPKPREGKIELFSFPEEPEKPPTSELPEAVTRASSDEAKLTEPKQSFTFGVPATPRPIAFAAPTRSPDEVTRKTIPGPEKPIAVERTLVSDGGSEKTQTSTETLDESPSSRIEKPLFGKVQSGESPFGGDRVDRPIFGSPQIDKPVFSVGGGRAEKSTFGGTPANKPIFRTAGADKSVFSASGKDKPVLGITGQDKPMFGTVTKDKPVHGTTAAEKPVFGTSVADKPAFGTAVTEKPAFGTPATEKPAFGTAATEKPMFGTAATEKPMFGTSAAEKPTFGTSTVDKIAFGTAATNKAVFGTAATEKPIFGTAAAEKPIFGTAAAEKTVFGTVATDKPTFVNVQAEKPVFGSSRVERSTFGSVPENRPAPFGSNPAEKFVTGAVDKPVFGSVAPNNIFASSVKPSTNGFAFEAEKKQQPVFSFGATADESVPAKIPAFSFSSAKPTFEFAAKPAENAFVFGARPNSFPGQKNEPAFGNAAFGATAEAQKAPVFDFGASASQPSKTFSFGGSQASVVPGGFSFGAPGAPPAFDPNTKPMFNFSGSSTPTAFTAQPAPGSTPVAAQRRVKRAVRRTQR